MSRRKTYRPAEIKAGHTLFIVVRIRPLGVVTAKYGVDEYLVASKREPQPEYGVPHPYRMHPLMAKHAADVTDLWKTRKAAWAEANRRQALEDAA